MSRIRANKITDKLGTGSVELEKGAHLPVGMGITGVGNINLSGIITATTISATTFTGVDSTAIKDSGGNVKIQAQASGAVYTGIHTFGTNTNFTDIDVDGHTNLDNLSVSGVATVTGDLNVGGVLTYEDVTNIDSVVLITARTVIRLDDDKKIILGTGGDFEIYHDTANRSGVRFTNPEFRLMAAGGTGNIQFGVSNSATELSYSALMAEFKKGAECTLNFNGSPKLATSNTGVTVTGTVAATSYTGDGSNLTGVNANVGITTNLSGTFTASAGSPSTINTFGYGSGDLVVEYTIYIKNGSDFQTQKLLAMRDGTTIHSTQFAVMFSSSLLVQCDATISSGNILLRATPETGVSGSTTYKIKREVM